jgi:transposase
MAAQRDSELADRKLRAPCRKVLESSREHWDGLTLFVNDPRIPMDNNYGERLMRGPAVGRKNYYGSGAAWSGRLAMMLFSIFATLALWKINPRRWLNWYFEACAGSGGRPPDDVTGSCPGTCRRSVCQNCRLCPPATRQPIRRDSECRSSRYTRPIPA